MQGAFWIFACYDNNRVSAMSMFGNTSQYYSKEHAFTTVRSRFSIPDYQPVVYVEPNEWNAPDVTATQASFNIDLQTINSRIQQYLETKGYSSEDILKALNTSSAVPNPSLGILLCCVDLRNVQAFTQNMQPMAYGPAPRYMQPVDRQQTAEYHPVMAVWVSIGIFIVTLAVLLFQGLARDMYTKYYASSAYSLLIYIFIGCAIFLLLQKGLKYKIFASAAFLLSYILQLINMGYQTVNGINLAYLLKNLAIVSNWTRPLILYAIVVGLSVLFLFLIKGQNKTKAYITAWICGAGLFIYQIILFIPQLGRIPAQYAIYTIISYIIRIACLVFIVYLLNALVSLKTEKILLTTGAKVWLSICIGFTALMLILSLAAGPFYIVILILPLMGITGYILLLCKIRSGFLLSLFAVALTVAISINLSIISRNAAYLVSIVGIINPTITWALIYNSWKGRINRYGQYPQY